MTRETTALTEQKTITISYPTPTETLQGTPTTLPTSEPGTPQVSYTVAATDPPTIGLTLYSKVLIGVVIAGGKVNTAATISWRMKHNGSSVTTGSTSVAASTYYTIQAFFYNCAVGDTLQISLWSNESDSNWDYNTYYVHFTRLVIWNKIRMLVNVSFVTLVQTPVLASGNPSGTSYSSYAYSNDLMYDAMQTAGPFTFSALYAGTTYGFFVEPLGDIYNANNAYFRTSSTYRPLYYSPFEPTKITLRGLRQGIKVD